MRVLIPTFCNSQEVIWGDENFGDKRSTHNHVGLTIIDQNKIYFENYEQPDFLRLLAGTEDKEGVSLLST